MRRDDKMAVLALVVVIGVGIAYCALLTTDIGKRADGSRACYLRHIHYHDVAPEGSR